MTAKKVKEKTHRDITRRVLRCPKVSFEARSLWLLIEARTINENWFCCVGMEKLAEESGHSVAWVKRHIKELQDQGLITIGKRMIEGHKVNEYALKLP